MKSSILFALCLLASLAALASCTTVTVCEQDQHSIDDCSLCCALNEFNKFDHSLYLKNGVCRCYIDKQEAEHNLKHPRALKKQKVEVEVEKEEA